MHKSNQSLKIKDLAEEDRPREKLLSKGINSLSDSELLAILLRSGSRDESAVELSKKLLITADNNLNQLGKLSLDDLIKLKGIGKAKALTIMAALEIGRRRKMADALERKQISSSGDVFYYFQSILGDLSHEEFWILLLNRSNKIIHTQRISQGGLSGTVIDVRVILKIAIEKLASSMILCHNHPSGNLKPSNSDIRITQQIKEASGIMDIPVLDHVIVTDENYYSFADEDLI